MDIFEFAIQMEIDGEKYYRDLIQASSSAGLRKIFTLLADEEVKHRTFLEQMRRKSRLQPSEASRILENVKNIFIEMKNEKDFQYLSTPGATAAYKKALEVEKQSMELYQKLAKEVQDDQAELLFTLLAKEEEKHASIMENIVEFISRPEPGNWLENAEWHHLDEY